MIPLKSHKTEVCETLFRGLHMGVIKAPLCNLRIGLARGVLGLEDIHRVADIF